MMVYGIYEAVAWAYGNTWIENEVFYKGSILTWVEAHTALPILPVQVTIYLAIILFPGVILFKYANSRELDETVEYLSEHDIQAHKYVRVAAFGILLVLALLMAYFYLVVNPVVV